MIYIIEYARALVSSKQSMRQYVCEISVTSQNKEILKVLILKESVMLQIKGVVLTLLVVGHYYCHYIRLLEVHPEVNMQSICCWSVCTPQLSPIPWFQVRFPHWRLPQYLKITMSKMELIATHSFLSIGSVIIHPVHGHSLAFLFDSSQFNLYKKSSCFSFDNITKVQTFLSHYQKLLCMSWWLLTAGFFALVSCCLTSAPSPLFSSPLGRKTHLFVAPIMPYPTLASCPFLDLAHVSSLLWKSSGAFLPPSLSNYPITSLMLTLVYPALPASDAQSSPVSASLCPLCRGGNLSGACCFSGR